MKRTDVPNITINFSYSYFRIPVGHDHWTVNCTTINLRHLKQLQPLLMLFTPVLYCDMAKGLEWKQSLLYINLSWLQLHIKADLITSNLIGFCISDWVMFENALYKRRRRRRKRTEIIVEPSRMYPCPGVSWNRYRPCLTPAG